MTRSQTVTKEVPLYNDGSSRVRGLAEGIAIKKAKYARECEGKNTAKRGSLPTANPPVRVPPEGRDKNVEFADTLLSQSTAACPRDNGDQSHRVAQDIVEAGHTVNYHCIAECHCMAKPDQPKAI